jgi:hypothetical protein
MAPNPRELVVARARDYLKTAENPKGSNSGLRINYWLDAVGSPQNSPWCAAFVWQVLVEALGISRVPIKRSGRVQDLVDHAKTQGWFTTDLGLFRPGDLVVIWYPTLSPARYGHVAIGESIDPRRIVSIDGNTSPNVAAGSAADREGYVVERKDRPRGPRLALIQWEIAA